ncbi:DNA internalization-related competence protein ComEC/Rec2 [Thiohalomonas denitrificans]|uniref:Competence protein ComEC n=1 Tax=Thiohalomonas denitrificans TaxID=415747 RepID=A0A1G5R1D5_9GAMM|nr:DNA internalization-related competence protein ComEC/Rec2 [Thiohalomonas denitrificans]SCZ67756.1 competence protein ComEC [Thiohalomonas denitrificans]
MPSGTIAFLLGVAALQLCAELPTLHWLLLAAGAPFVAHLFLRSRNYQTAIFAVSAGFLWAWFHAGAVLSNPLPESLEGEDLMVWGSVEDLPDRDGRRIRFLFRPDRLEAAGTPVVPPGRLRLSWYGRDHPEIIPGERWRLLIRLKRPRGLFNPGSFDYERWLFQNGIRATGYVRDSDQNRREAPGRGLDAWRDRISKAVGEALEHKPGTDLILALAVGDRREIAPERWQVLAATGTTHLMAISGLHIGFIAGLAYFLARLMWSRCASCCAHVAAPRAAAVLAGAAALAYAGLAGFSVPTQRALVMAAVALGAVATGRKITPGFGLSAALLAVLLIDPLAVLSIGFWLSFAAVAVILFGLHGRLRRVKGWGAWIRVQFLVGLGLFPLLIAAFDSASLISPLANLAAVPWVGFIVVPVTLAGALLLPLWETAGAGLLEVARLALEKPWPLLESLAGAEPVGSSVALWTLMPAAAGVFWMMAPRGIPARWLGVFGLLPMLLFRPSDLPHGMARLALLDVGQGLSAVVETAGHVLVYDTGPRFSASFDAGSAVVAPYLRTIGTERVDTLVLSHGDGDHVGGLPALKEALSIGRILQPDVEQGTQTCRTGETWNWDGVRFEVLHPDFRGGDSENNASCVLRVTAGGHRLLLPGDIETPGEERLLGNGVPLRAELIVAPHHGSSTSSSAAFVEAVQPEWVFFPAGAGNRWGFPAKTVLNRYRESGAKALTTGNSGPILVEMGGESLRVRSYREYARRYWHH